MVRKLTFTNRKESLAEPSKFCKRIHGLTTNICPLVDCPKVNFQELDRKHHRALQALERNSKLGRPIFGLYFMAHKLTFWNPNKKPHRAFQVWGRNTRPCHPNLGLWIMVRKLTFKNLKEGFAEPSKFWKGIQGLTTQILGLSLWTER